MSSQYKDIPATAFAKEAVFLKRASNQEEVFSRGVSLPKCGGLLIPLCEAQKADDTIVRDRLGWKSYTEDHETSVGSVLEDDNQILFFVLDVCGRRVGQVGLTRSTTEDATLLVSNVAFEERRPDLATEAIQELVEWARKTLWPDTVQTAPALENADAGKVFGQLGFSPPTDERRRSVGHLVLNSSRDLNRSKLILTAGPSVSSREASYTFEAAKYGWNNQWKKYLTAFEEEFAEYIGVKHAITTSSCTGALHIALQTLGVGAGDEVIVPDITWVATASAVLYTGATPVFADIEPGSWCLDPASFESLINEKTKAVMPVHLYGHPSKMDDIMAIAEKHGLHVIEDAAPAIGATVAGKRTGSFGAFAAFSFQGAKLLVAGEGGMLLTDDTNLYEEALSYWDHGKSPERTFWVDRLGFKYKMSNMQAAFGLGQLQRNDEMVEAKRRIFSWYEEGLSDVPELELNREMPWARSIYWMSSVLVNERSPLERDEVACKLKEMNIDTRPVFPAISQYPFWPVAQAPQPVALRVGDRAINLPSGVCLSRDEVDYVCDCLRKLMKR